MFEVDFGIEPLELSCRSLMGVILSPEKIDDVPQNIEKIKAEQVKYKEQIVKLREAYVYSFGRSSMVGVRHMVDLVNKHDEVSV